MGKAIEKKNFTLTLKTVLSEFNLYWKFMCTGKNNGKNKIAELTLGLWLQNLQTFL